MKQTCCSVFPRSVPPSERRGLVAGRIQGLLVGFFLAVAALSAPAQDEAITNNVEPSTVRILSRTAGGLETGSGFVVDGGHVVTNWHVVAEAASNPIVILGPGKKADARLVGGNEQKDLAILELDHSVGNPPVKFARREFVRKTETVYVLGFPSAADENPNIDQRSTLFEVKVSKGIVSGFVRSRFGVNLYETDAAVNPGNSGGPMADECGDVIGISVMAALVPAVVVGQDESGQPVPVPRRLPEGTGIAWAISADELMPELNGLRVRPQVASSACSLSTSSSAPIPTSSTPPLLVAAVVGALILGGVGVYLAATKRGRSAMTQVFRGAPRPRALTPPAKPIRWAILRAVSGDLVGSEVRLDQNPVTVGRDPNACQMVFPSTADLISKRHCILRRDRQRGVLLEDCGSMNGTFLQSGERLTPGSPRRLDPNDCFYLADPLFMFEIKEGGR